MARILVVDDDTDILKVVEKVLNMAGHEVSVASDAMKAMDFLNSSLFDLLITDANMPHFSGFELARTLKNNKRFHRMGICMLTGLREKRDIEKAIRAGVDDYIVKPIDPTLLMQKVDLIFKKKPPLDIVEYHLPEKSHLASAQISSPARITLLTEDGFTLRIPFGLDDGVHVQISADLLKKISLQTNQPMRVVSCHKISEADYEVRLAFTSINESLRQRIREWMTAQSSSRKGAA